MPRRKTVSPSPPEASLSFAVNGHTLSGERRNGEWTFACSFPAVAKKWNGDTTLENAITDFMTRALAGAVTVKTLAQSLHPPEPK